MSSPESDPDLMDLAIGDEDAAASAKRGCWRAFILILIVMGVTLGLVAHFFYQ